MTYVKKKDGKDNIGYPNPTIFKDRIVDLILKESREELKKELGIDIPEEVLMEIANSQFSLLPVAFANKQTVKLTYLGKFKVKEGRKYKLACNRTEFEYGGKFYLVKKLEGTLEENQNIQNAD